jgi:concentrative nucleoside transporter, CNT family
MSSNQESVDPKVAPEHATDAPAQEGERRHTHHDLPEHGHNMSMQRSVDENPDIALHYSHEHQHQHLHHGRPSLSGKHDEVLYADGTNPQDVHFGNKNAQDYVHHTLRKPSVEPVNEKDFVSSDDAEKGDIDHTMTSDSSNDVKRHRFSRFYAKYKIFFHIAIW